MQKKYCPKCKETKSSEYFGKDKRSKSGLQVYCKSCRKKYRQANKETIAINQKAYRQANKETIATQEKRWRQANKEGFAAQQKSYYESNKDVFKRRHMSSTPENIVYLTKRLTSRRADRAFEEAFERAMNDVGYVVEARDGWVVKVHENGEIERIERLEAQQDSSNFSWSTLG